MALNALFKHTRYPEMALYLFCCRLGKNGWRVWFKRATPGI